MYFLTKNQRGYFLREGVGEHVPANRKVVMFKLESRDADKWQPFLTTAKDALDNYPAIGGFIGTLDGPKKEEWKKFDEEIASIVRKHKDELWRKKALILNKHFRRTKIDESLDGYFLSKKSHYRNVCWRCHDDVDSSHELTHRECGWLICSNCGACGCGYKKA